jgi:hypothetical protein
VSPRRADLNRARRAGVAHGQRHPLGAHPIDRPPYTSPEMQRAWHRGVARGRAVHWERVRTATAAVFRQLCGAYTAMARAGADLARGLEAGIAQKGGATG